MRRFFDLSLRHKLPLWGSALIIAATLLVSSGLMYRAYADLKHDVIVSATGLGQTLAKPLFQALLHDDLWRAIETINAPLQEKSRDAPMQASVIFILDPALKIKASTSPRSMPLDAGLSDLGDDYRLLADALTTTDPQRNHIFEFPASDYLHITTPLAEEGGYLGTLVITHSKSDFLPRFSSIAFEGAGMGLLALAILLPINWYWGRRMAEPLVQLASNMAQMVRGAPANLNPELYAYHDELGQLFNAYRQAAVEISAKAALEHEMLRSERLAAVGRLAAGIAHEVNNPLTGMLIALDNLKHHDVADCNDAKLLRALEFLERGLLHVSETVGALLVETRVQLRPLEQHDFEDVRTLIEPQAISKSLRLDWQVAVTEAIPVAAGQVRQILINLLLNAVQATANGGEIRLSAERRNDELWLEVANDGAPPSPEVLAHIFEPFVSGREGGHGLGLWVTYQTVQQLGGNIVIDTPDGKVIFRVRLPIKEVK